MIIYYPPPDWRSWGLAGYIRVYKAIYCFCNFADEDGQVLRRRHEPDIMARIAPRKRDYHDVAFFPLVVVYARCV